MGNDVEPFGGIILNASICHSFSFQFCAVLHRLLIHDILSAYFNCYATTASHPTAVATALSLLSLSLSLSVEKSNSNEHCFDPQDCQNAKNMSFWLRPHVDWVNDVSIHTMAKLDCSSSRILWIFLDFKWEFVTQRPFSTFAWLIGLQRNIHMCSFCAVFVDKLGLHWICFATMTQKRFNSGPNEVRIYSSSSSNQTECDKCCTKLSVLGARIHIG